MLLLRITTHEAAPDRSSNLVSQKNFISSRDRATEENVQLKPKKMSESKPNTHAMDTVELNDESANIESVDVSKCKFS